MRQVRLGFSGAVSPGASVHGPTLLRAVEMALPLVEARWDIAVQAVWADDGACMTGGAEAARRLVNCGVSAVVGHYASSAALGAAEVYATHGIALYLPAATASVLTSAPGVYRLCDNDTDYCDYLLEVLRSMGMGSVGVSSDRSTHGTSVVGLLKALSPQFHDAVAEDQVLLYAGSCAKSREFLTQCTTRYPRIRELVLCDDVMTPEAIRDFGSAPVGITVVGLSCSPRTAEEESIAAQYLAQWGAAPGVYFFETVAALEVAVSHLLRPEALPQTSAGLLQLHRDAIVREARPLRFAVVRTGCTSDSHIRHATCN